jgi:hypothetical protein
LVIASLLLMSLAFQTASAEEAAPKLTVERSDVASTLSLGGGAPFHSTTARVTGARMIYLPATGTRLVLWSESESGVAKPFYAIGQNQEPMGSGKSTSYDLKLLHGPYDPVVHIPQVKTELSSPAHSNLYLVQFVTQPLEEFRAEIVKLGGTVEGFLTNHAHVVKMNPNVRNEVAALPFVRWIGPYHPAYRIEKHLRENEITERLRYSILVFEGGKEPVAERIAAMGATVDTPNAGKYLLNATLTREQLVEVAGWDEVQYIDRWSPLEPDMDIVREIGGADYIETVAGYTGAGVRGESFDTGFNVNHPDFQLNPLIQHGGTVGNDNHGTACIGVLFGTGTGDARARGLMPDGQGIVADYNNIGLTGTSRYDHSGELLGDPYYAVFQTASVGSDRTFDYTTISADHDTLLFDWDLVHCQSQSNAGNQDSRPQAWAKNVVSGGAVQHYDTLTRDDDSWSGGSASIGPAADGRIKPDLCFFYDDTYTTYTTGTGYGEFGGTSGATPTICGHFGLFFQMWNDGIFGNDVDPEGTVFDNRPHMTTAKAFMINTATQYPFTGTGHDLTRVHQGWGMPNVQTLYDMRDDISFIDESVLLANMESVEYVAIVDPGEPAMRITMTYADPAGNPAAAEHRINDLTLKATSPSSVVYWGNNGLLEGNWSTPGGEADTIDTVENVFIENPEEGIWFVEIMASEINQDSHVETPEVDADFALVVSGAFLKTCTSNGVVNLNGAKYACEDDAIIRVVDCDLNTDDNVVETVSVTIDSDTEPAGESVLLTETGAATAKFQGTIPISQTAAAGVLQVSAGDTVTVTYIDADDGEGGTDVTKTDTAVVDCTPPVITNVQTANIEPRGATVTFDTDEAARGTVRYGDSCAALTETVSANSYSTAHSLIISGLQDDSTYFYAVDAMDQVGNGSSDDNAGACYSFSTPEIPDFFTELFDSGNDLDLIRLTFQPNGSVDFYGGCSDPIAIFPSDPAGGTTLTLSDDGNALVTLSGATVSLYGTSYSEFYVNSNGNITFGSSDGDYTETLADHFDLPRISALFDDLNPSTGGTVSWKQLPDRVVVTWEGVPEHSTSNSNDFQIEMYFNGVIAINYLNIAASDGLAGLSEGDGLSPDFYESDLSGMLTCGGTACWDGVLGEGEERIDCGGPCPPCQCLSDGECEDGLFCTGVESCNEYGVCTTTGNPCTGQQCKESDDTCVDCLTNSHCDDGLFCNGVEICLYDNSCMAGPVPCPWTTCDDGSDTCIICDNDGGCEPGEDCFNCPNDCLKGTAASCGNTICDVAVTASPETTESPAPMRDAPQRATPAQWSRYSCTAAETPHVRTSRPLATARPTARRPCPARRGLALSSSLRVSTRLPV